MLVASGTPSHIVYIHRPFPRHLRGLRVKGALVINKTDLLDEPGRRRADRRRKLSLHLNRLPGIYRFCTLGVRPRCFGRLSPRKGDLISATPRGQVIAYQRPSYRASLRTAEISGSPRYRMHTTTFSEMYDLPAEVRLSTPRSERLRCGGVCVRRSGALLPRDFPHLGRLPLRQLHSIRMSSGCAVLKAVEEHSISESRYNSYMSILEETVDTDDKYRKNCDGAVPLYCRICKVRFLLI